MVKKSNIDRLKQDALRASRLQHTLSSDGWRDIQEIFQEEYNSNMNSLLEKENPEARGAINAIVRIMDSISQELKFGDNAKNKYKEQYLNNQ